MNFLQRIIGMFIKPDQTTEDISKEPRIEEALLIVGIYALMVILNTYISTSHVRIIYNFPGAENLTNMQGIMMAVSLVFSLVLTLVFWPIVTGILHLFSLAFGGTGKFYPQMMTEIGHTYLPKIIAVAISALLLTQAPVVTIELTSQGLQSLTAMDAINQFYSSPFYLASTIVTLLGLLYSCIMGVFALKNGEKLNLTQSAIIIGVSLAVYLIITYGSTYVLRLMGF